MSGGTADLGGAAGAMFGGPRRPASGLGAEGSAGVLWSGVLGKLCHKWNTKKIVFRKTSHHHRSGMENRPSG